MSGLDYDCDYCNSFVGHGSFCSRPECIIAARKEFVSKLEIHFQTMNDSIRSLQEESKQIAWELSILKKYFL